MADISLIPGDILDDSDEGVFEQGDGPSGDHMDDDTSLPPLRRIRKYAFSDRPMERQMVSRVLMDLFKTGPILSADLPQIMQIVSQMSEDLDIMVKTVFLKQIPNIASTALECAGRIPELSGILTEYLLPIVVRNLGVSDNPVSKVAQMTLITLLEKGLVNRQQAEIQVCPTILSLSNVDTITDCNTGAVTLMSRLLPFLGQDVTERVFLERFSQLCSNHIFYVRKMCASHFGDFCAVIGKEAYERILLPCYIALCGDDIWGVRKACADVVISVSCVCPPVKRRSDLAPVFARLLQDQSRWVRMSAFQSLGPFISTFAEPTITSLAYNSIGDLVLVNNNGTEFRISPTYSDASVFRPISELRMFYQFQDTTNVFGEDEEEDEVDITICHPMNELIDYDLGDSKEVRIENVALEVEANNSEETNLNDTNVFNGGSMIHATDLTVREGSLNNHINSGQCENNVLNSVDNLKVDNPIINHQNNNDRLDVKEIVENTVKNVVLSFKHDSNSGDQELSNIPNVMDKTNKPFYDNAFNKADEFFLSDDEVFKIMLSSCDRDGGLKTVGASNNNSLNNQNHNCTKNNEVEILEQYNSYNYWYISPELPLDPSIINPELPVIKQVHHTSRNDSFSNNNKEYTDVLSNKISNNEQSNSSNSLPYPKMDKVFTDKFSVYLQRESNGTNEVTNTKEEQEVDKQQQLQNVIEPPQHIVPQLLIDHFVSMTDPTLAQDTDNEMAYHCAYSLPAVALTLGSKNWHLLKDTVEVLAGNMQYKVRRTVASSLHELATILGPDIATNNLTPIFEGFIKDLDEVRIGVLKHLANFLKLINPSKRNVYLPRLAEFLRTDNEANWRFRQELAEQLLLAVPLFRPGDATKHISILARELLCDKVAAVREVALLLFTELIRHISGDVTLTSRLLVNLAEKFAHSKRWKWRQCFALLCANLLLSQALPPEQFASEVMPHLLDLSWDPVANVRLVVARTISQHIVTNDYFTDVSSQHYDGLQTVLRRLQSDKDRDVRQCAVFQTFTNVQ